MRITLYGIKNCDTVKKARTWLDQNGRAYTFHDYRADGLSDAALQKWVNSLGWEKLLNKASTTFKELPDADKADLNKDKAIALMLRQPTVIKRPVLDVNGHFTVGFKPELYEQTFAAGERAVALSGTP